VEPSELDVDVVTVPEPVFEELLEEEDDEEEDEEELTTAAYAVSTGDISAAIKPRRRSAETEKERKLFPLEYRPV
jgi:hypothetical protein